MTKFDDTNGELSYLPEYQAKGAESMEELASRMVGFIEENGENTREGDTCGDPRRSHAFRNHEIHRVTPDV